MHFEAIFVGQFACDIIPFPQRRKITYYTVASHNLRIQFRLMSITMKITARSPRAHYHTRTHKKTLRALCTRKKHESRKNIFIARSARFH